MSQPTDSQRARAIAKTIEAAARGHGGPGAFFMPADAAALRRLADRAEEDADDVAAREVRTEEEERGTDADRYGSLFARTDSDV